MVKLTNLEKEIYKKELPAFENFLFANQFDKKGVEKHRERFLNFVKREAELQSSIKNEFLISDKKKEEIEQKAKITSSVSIKQNFLDLFNQYSYCNETVADMLFYVMCSVILKKNIYKRPSNKKLRLHLHQWWIQSSGSGKDQGLDLIELIVHRYNKTVSLLNQEREDPLPIIKTFNLSGTETMESLLNSFVYDSKKRKNDYTQIISGILEKYDLLISRECSYYFTEKRGDKQTKAELLLEALEGRPSQKVLKSWEGHMTTTTCDACFIGTTRPFENIKRHIVNSGLQQRGMNFCRVVDSEIRQQMNLMVSKYSFSSKYTQSEFNSKLDTFVSDLIKIHDFALNNTIKPKNSSELSKLLNDNLLTFYQDCENQIVKKEHREILDSFIARFEIIAIKICYISALINLRAEIQSEDLQIAFNMLSKEYEQLKVWIESSITEEQGAKKERQITRKILKSFFMTPGGKYLGDMPRADLKKRLANALEISESYAYKIIKDYSAGKKKILEINDKIISFIR